MGSRGSLGWTGRQLGCTLGHAASGILRMLATSRAAKQNSAGYCNAEGPRNNISMLQAFPASVLPFVPLVLRTYWSLAAGAALFALLPTSLAPSFRCFSRLCCSDALLQTLVVSTGKALCWA